MRRPPRPTLFPYTTLFRSRAQRGDHVLEPLLVRHHDVHVAFHDDCAALFSDRAPGEVETVECGALIHRKSTRLNSSHSSISYAVFCLKKKMFEWTGGGVHR